MRRILLSAATLLAVAPLLHAQLPVGWSARLDNAQMALADVKFVTMGPGLHLTTGPHVILWREADRTDGRFHTEVTITRTKAPAHPESYGLIFGGRDLAGPNQTYLYFLVRGDGKYYIRKREGTTVSNVVSGWTDHAAINKADAAGKVTDKLEIAATATTVRFLVNGQLVHEMPTAGLNLEGHVGLRASHALDLHLDGFVVHKM
jgi:hypothetical protein